MSEEQRIKEKCIEMAAEDFRLLLTIIGDLGYPGYRIAICKLRGASYTKCCISLGVSRAMVQRYWKKCKIRGYDSELRRMFNF
jgi:hypothetical protein